ncbi:MAG: antibiotic biosynthesis monooxygenase [Saprospirales bacterium]|nr:MAG: antibiotic biosynthesis monooxygenase [Saprospirales bacterium]
MFTRLVKLVISPGKEDQFLEIFNKSCEAIRSFDGCNALKLFRDRKYPNVFFTYSIWESPIHLDNYRKSNLFRQTWESTKVLFADKPDAWSMDLTYDADTNQTKESK